MNDNKASDAIQFEPPSASDSTSIAGFSPLPRERFSPFGMNSPNPIVYVRYESAVGEAFPAIVPTALFEHVEGSVRATEGNIVSGVNFNTFQPAVAIHWLVNPGRVIYDIVAAKICLICQLNIWRSLIPPFVALSDCAFRCGRACTRRGKFGRLGRLGCCSGTERWVRMVIFFVLKSPQFCVNVLTL